MFNGDLMGSETGTGVRWAARWGGSEIGDGGDTEQAKEGRAVRAGPSAFERAGVLLHQQVHRLGVREANDRARVRQQQWPSATFRNDGRDLRENQTLKTIGPRALIFTLVATFS